MRVLVPLVVFVVTIGTTLFWLDHYNVLGRYPRVEILSKGSCETTFVRQAPFEEEKRMRNLGGIFISNDLRAYNAEMDLYQCLCQSYERRPTLDVAEHIVDYVVNQMPAYTSSDPQTSQAKHALTQQVCRDKAKVFVHVKPQ